MCSILPQIVCIIVENSSLMRNRAMCERAEVVAYACMRVHECRIVFFIQNARAREREQAYGTVGYWTKVKFILHYFSVRKWADVLQKYAWACVFTACDFCLHFNCDDVSLFGCTREIFLVRAEQQLACFFFVISKFGIFNRISPTQRKTSGHEIEHVCTCVM